MVELRKAFIEDIDKIYELHKTCFDIPDHVYNMFISTNLENTIVPSINNKIIGGWYNDIL